MKRLEAFISKKVNEVLAKNKEKRVKAALNAALLNFEDKKEEASIKIDEVLSSLSESKEVNSVIQKVSDLFGEKEECQKGIERINTILNYLDEEVKE